jgi:hypothetical protein
MIINKRRQTALVHWSDDSFTEVSFFLQDYAEAHSGRELILDVLNSSLDFLPVEDAEKKKVRLVNKQHIRWVELKEREYVEQNVLPQEQLVEVEMIGGKVFRGRFPVEMPPERSRLSDHLNFTPRFIYLLQEDHDLILSKSFLLLVRDENRR